MATQTQAQTQAWLVANTQATEDKAEWVVALWYGELMGQDLSRKDMAHLVISGNLTIGNAWASLAEAIWDNGEDDEVREAIADYF